MFQFVAFVEGLAGKHGAQRLSPGTFPLQLRAKVGIARAIVAHPKVVVADEPTGSLDAETSEQVQVLLQRLNKELNITMLMVTHDSNVASIASRQLMLDRGKFLEAIGS